MTYCPGVELSGIALVSILSVAVFTALLLWESSVDSSAKPLKYKTKMYNRTRVILGNPSII